MLTDFNWNEAKKNFFFEKKIQNGRLKKTSFSCFANSQYFFMKFSWIGPWVSRIDWCGGHWFGSTNMVVRQPDISSKMPKKHKKCIFCLFLSLCRTASPPYRLSPINALCINHSWGFLGWTTTWGNGRVFQSFWELENNSVALKLLFCGIVWSEIQSCSRA